ncbi:MAG: Peptidase domain protein [Verrucomicrobiales bacterium]|nr:Peptidase domain protein [Verrucomicrobiales bacterium]
MNDGFISRMFDPEVWAAVPFHFWSLTFFVFGSMVGSFLNVCIYRMPRGESIVRPPSHCPHCNYSIPWYLNMPLFTWTYLHGKCANCKAPITVRYFLVELLTALLFLGCWLGYGHSGGALVALAYCVLVAGLVVATFIDFEHFIIPDEITLGGIAVGFICSLIAPGLHQSASRQHSLFSSLVGGAVGGGIVYAILRLGKLLFGKQKIAFEKVEKMQFLESSLKLPDEEIPYNDLFYRDSDVIIVRAKTVRMKKQDWTDVTVKLTPKLLSIGNDTFPAEEVKDFEVTADNLVLPREAMGFGDVKFMAAIGAFQGASCVIFSLMASSVIGSVVGILLIRLKKHEWSSKLPYGPYIALGALIWIFGGRELWNWWFARFG